MEILLNFIDLVVVVKTDMLKLVSCILTKRLLSLELLKERNLVLSLLSIISAFIFVFIGEFHYIVPESDDQLALAFELRLYLLVFSLVFGYIFSIIFQFFQQQSILFFQVLVSELEVINFSEKVLCIFII